MHGVSGGWRIVLVTHRSSACLVAHGCGWGQRVRMGPAGADGASGCGRGQWVRMEPVGADGASGCGWGQWVQMGPVGAGGH